MILIEAVNQPILIRVLSIKMHCSYSRLKIVIISNYLVQSKSLSSRCFLTLILRYLLNIPLTNNVTLVSCTCSNSFYCALSTIYMFSTSTILTYRKYLYLYLWSLARSTCIICISHSTCI